MSRLNIAPNTVKVVERREAGEDGRVEGFIKCYPGRPTA